jgi:hypothetical protein
VGLDMGAGAGNHGIIRHRGSIGAGRRARVVVMSGRLLACSRVSTYCGVVRELKSGRTKSTQRLGARFRPS